MIRPDNFVKINILSAMPPEPGKEKKKKSHKHNKQKPDVQLNGDASESELAKKPKKRKIQDNQSPSKNTLKSNVVQVIAEPGQLLPRPSIFKRSNREQLANAIPSSNFIKKINFENFNLETFNSERFTNSLNLNEGSKKITPPEENGLPKNRVENTIVIDDNSDQMETIVIDDEKNHPLKSTNSTPVEKSSPEVVNENQDTSSSSAVKDKSQIGVRKMREAVIRAYQVPHQNAFIVHIQDPSEFSFIGKMRLTLLVGCLQVFGTYLEPDESHDLYFPKFCTTPVIRTVMPSGELEIEELETFLLNKNLITKSNMKKLLNEIKPMDSVAFIEDSPCNFVKVFEKYWDKPLFSDFPPMTSLPEISHCFFNLRNSNSVKEFRNNPAWDELHLGGCNFICGGKNVGKSSLLKYLINTRISETQNAVVCLDLDPGQPEFCPPGCLAITILRKKVFGPNFVQVVEPEKMVFYGEVSVAQQPIAYLEAAQFIIDYYRNDPVLSDMPCFVNTMGFCKGLGVDLTVSVIKLLRPDTIIQITSTDNKNNFPYHFTPERIKSSESHIFNIPDTSDFSYEFNLLESYSEEDGVQLLGGLKPRDLRDLKLLSYFSQMVTPERPDFNSVQPYSIHFSKLYLAVQGAITPNEILKAFNGNMVGLCEYKEDRTCEVLESVENDYFKILMKPKTMPCLALGFVRGIDVTSKTIYVITHLSSAVMETVNCLTLGFLTPPHSIYLKQDTVEGPIPYTSINSGDNVQMVKRAYRFPRNQTA